MELITSADEDLFVEIDEERHLVFGTLPILGTERKDGQPFDTEVVACLDDLEE